MTPNIQHHLKQYLESEQALIDYIQANMPVGAIVYVDSAGFTGFAKSRGPYKSRVDWMQVTLHGGTAWEFALESVRPITDEERKDLPKWLQK